MEEYVRQLLEYNPNYDAQLLEKAYLTAEKYHEGQLRKSGEPYIIHPMAVGRILADLGMDEVTIAGGILHDIVEDTDYTLAQVEVDFGTDIANLVDGVTKLTNINYETKEEQQAENIRKMFLAMSKDIRVLIIKLADRLHNLRTISYQTPKKIREKCQESLDIYAPLAARLGIYKFKFEMEDICFKNLYPEEYDKLVKEMQERQVRRQGVIESVIRDINKALEDTGIQYEIYGRQKHYYSIYKKMQYQQKQLDEIFDLTAVRIIVDSIRDCYGVLGAVHTMWTPIPGRFKDYIAMPKPNRYQSLHTTVIGKNGNPFEIQIRTKEMHRTAEYGIAAHWKYKSGASSKEEIDQKLAWISRLIDTENGAIDTEDFMHALKIDIFSDETFVFTPKGDVIALPVNSTLIDFAYAIHSEVGNKMVGAKINGMIAPIDRVPQTGDIVEVLTSSASKGPSRDWLKIVKTSEARAKIRQWFKKEKRPENIKIGQAEIERVLSRWRIRPTDAQLEEIVAGTAKKLGMADVDDLYNAVGYNGIAMTKVSSKLKQEYERVVKPEETPITDVAEIETGTIKKRKSSGGIIVDGADGCEVKFAKCCNPLPGDEIVGFVTKGYGISIHKRDCPNAVAGQSKPEQADRWLHAEWDNDEYPTGGKPLYEVGLQIYAENDIRLLSNITTALADMKVTLLGINTKKRTESDIIIQLTVGCKNIDHYNSILSRLRSIPHVENIERGIS